MGNGRIEEVEVPDSETVNDVLPEDVDPGTVELTRRPDDDGNEATYARYEREPISYR